MNKKLLLTPIVALILSACDAVSERDCGVFDHPDLGIWQPDLNATNVTFMSEEGISISFTRAAVTFSEPFLATDGSANDEDVICEVTATFRYEATDSNLAISSVYVQFESFLLDSDDETLAVDHVIESPAGTILEGSFLADISQVSENNPRTILSPSRIQYLDTELAGVDIGGQSFLDVVRVNAPGFVFVEQVVDETAEVEEGEEAETEIVTIPIETETTTDDAVPASDAIQQIVVGRDAGLIAFSDDEGTEFVRIATP